MGCLGTVRMDGRYVRSIEEPLKTRVTKILLYYAVALRRSH